MTMIDAQTNPAVAELLRLEAERCRAISEQDWPALDRLLASTLSHTHMNGLTQDRATYLAHVQQRPRVTTRGDLSVRVYGDTAVISGPMWNTAPGSAPVQATVLQVWVREEGGWRQAAFQASRVE